MECHEGVKMIKTFRGLIAHGGQDIIALHTNNGAIGYRVVKFELFSTSPSTVRTESLVKIYKVRQGVNAETAIDGQVDFNDQTLVGVAFLGNYEQAQYVTDPTVIFDNEIFNQDIYVTHDSGDASSVDVNYYIELEQIKLDLNENTVATLKDIRNQALIPVGPP